MTGQYDVIFVRRKGNAIEHTEFIARNVSKAEASRLATRYSCRQSSSDADADVQVVHHGTIRQAVESAFMQ